MTTVKAYVRQEDQFPFILRVLWFFLIGWHVTLYWVVAAWLLNLTIIGMPLGLWMLNRVPLVLTLRTQRSYAVAATRSGGLGRMAQPKVCRNRRSCSRALYFILIGFWFSLIWALWVGCSASPSSGCRWACGCSTGCPA